jgi:peptidoglycan/xylan/chitin deacetylase (PgdA/CDA1 family)
MKIVPALLCLWTTLQIGAFCQNDGTSQPVPGKPPSTPSLADDGVRVAILGYHDFSETEPETEMRIRTSKFREQMQSIRDRGITVIPMADFIAWKNGEKTIPKRSVVITIDDGWKSVYTDAYPILKEFNYPYTLFLYKNYVDGGGKALAGKMIQEMIRNGATIGNHSATHPYPLTVKTARNEGPEAYDKFLNAEMLDSKRFLERKFSKTVTIYAYPGGFHTDEMLIKAKQIGYTHLFTVLPGKVDRTLPDNLLPRYIILGTHDRIFDLALDFGEPQEADSDSSGPSVNLVEAKVKLLEFHVNPQPNAIINSRTPNIEVDFSDAQNIDTTSIRMHVSGFGEVPANYASVGKLFSWQVNRRLRNPTCEVRVTWNDLQGKPTAKPLEWSFQIDHDAAYLPDRP